MTSITTKDDESPVVVHFRNAYGASTKGFKCMVIYKLELPERRRDWVKFLLQKEAKWIFLLDSL